MKKWTLYFFVMLLTNTLASQIVESVATHPKIVDGLHVDAAGNIYTTPGGLVNGFSIGKATPTGEFDPNFQTGLNGPIDIEEDSNGQLFITNYDNNSLKKVNPFTNEIATILTGIDGPAGLTIDQNDNIFLTCFGAPPSYDGNQIIKVSPNGNTEVWLETTDFYRPQGICFDHQGNLWVSNTPTGKIFRIDTITKEPELILELEAKVGNLVFRKKDSLLYFCSQGNHQIYKMTTQGILDTLAGTGIAGSIDGEVVQAQFNRPLGLGFTASEDTLYIAESGKLRRIIALNDTPVQAITLSPKSSIKIFPNPTSGWITITIPDGINFYPDKVSVLSDAGQLFFENEISASGNGLKIPILHTGMWFIHLHSKEKEIVEKVIVY